MRIFILAGEISGDKLGGALMQGLQELLPGQEIEYQGIGGPLMQAQGVTSLFPMEELSVMGLVEILSQYRHLNARVHQTAEAVLAMQPDVLITIDAPEFSLRVAKLVKAKSNIRTVHYVAPTVWAWRSGRARKMAAHIDQVLALLPFEPPFMEEAGMRCDFVGHPIATEVQATEDERLAFRRDHGLEGHPSLLVLPGSRRGEISRLMPIFKEVVDSLCKDRPDLRIVIPTVANIASDVRDAAADWPGQPVIVDPSGVSEDEAARQKRAAFAATDAALAASGTVSLELAAAGTPMVVAYDMNWLSRTLVMKMLLVDSVTLVNLVSETRSVPEFIGAACQPGPIAVAMDQVLSDPGDQHKALDLTMARLGKGGESPGLRAAKAILDGLSSSAAKH